jgi:hypothetical protein
MPYVTEISLFAAAFIASYAFAGPLMKRTGFDQRAARLARRTVSAIRRFSRF